MSRWNVCRYVWLCSAMIKETSDGFISRPGLAARWKCHTESLKRREKKGLLHPHRFSSRMVRYLLSEVLALERQAQSGEGAAAGPTQIPGRFGPTAATDHALGTRTHGAHGRPMKRARRVRKDKGVDIQFDFPPSPTK